MTIKESLYFTYDGISSHNMGISNVNISSGLMEESFFANREIVEHRVRGNNKPYFQEIQEKPLEFTIQCYFENGWDNDTIRSVARWLIQPYYKELYFSDNPSRRFYAIIVDDSTLIHNGAKQGYIEIKFRCNSPYAYSPVFESPVYDYSTNSVGGSELEFLNAGDLPLRSELWILSIDGSEVRIQNKTNGGLEFKFTGLSSNEEVYVDNENEYIKSNLPGVYRYDQHNGTFLELERGLNKLQIYGNCKIKFRYAYKLLQG